MNYLLHPILAAVDGSDWKDYVRPRGLTPGAMQMLILIGAVLFVTTVIFIWAVGFRKPHRRRHHHHHSHSDQSSAEELESARSTSDDDPEHPGRRRRRWRRQRRPHRRRNPTLAETGGLPPMRSGDPPKPEP